ncbi:hypothetical protein AB9P05_06495 [Roseivirga sp. BDSF3-8]|uniref:hypothetical protein n=1 Tax=Roseivirga sp. BDSF3-8 TaxID=3241598 RepID=UPI003532590C
MRYHSSLIALLLICIPSVLSAQQVPDSTYSVSLANPSYPTGKGPRVLIDGAHGNFHTLHSRFAAFGNVLQADGYTVHSLDTLITPSALAGAEVFVIANSLHPSNLHNWAIPTPSAFTEEEISVIISWVEQGGKLFLIADHMPFPGAIQELAEKFGVQWENNFALDQRRRKPEIYSRANGQLTDHPVVAGHADYLEVDSVAVFTGSAFIPPPDAEPVMLVDQHYTLMSPDKAWEFSDKTPHKSGKGYAQGALLPYGEGKVVLWGEAAMLSAQLAGPGGQYKMGMNAPEAKNNYKLLINLIRWLDK